MAKFDKIVKTFTKAMAECAKHCTALDKKAGKCQDKIFKLECKRELARIERERTYNFGSKLKEMLGMTGEV